MKELAIDTYVCETPEEVAETVVDLLRLGSRQVAVFVRDDGCIEVSSPIPAIAAADPPKEPA